MCHISYIVSMNMNIKWKFLNMCSLFPRGLEPVLKSRGYILTANVSLEYEKSEDGDQGDGSLLLSWVPTYAFLSWMISRNCLD